MADDAAVTVDRATNTVSVGGEKIGEFFISSQHISMIDKWFVDWFHGASAMRDTEAFNHVRHAVDDLKQRLTEEKAQ